VLNVSRSGYYAWEARPPSLRAARDVELVREIATVHAESDKRYGSPRVHRELRAKGERIGKNHVARLMAEHGIVGKRRRRFRITTDSSHSLPCAPNVLERNFTTDAPNKVWVTDITYIRTGEGWLYLAAILDLFSRRVVGWR
jgi:transposase InsO family protein